MKLLLIIFLVFASLTAISVIVYVINDMIVSHKKQASETSLEEENCTKKMWPTVLFAATLMTALFNGTKKVFRMWRDDKNPHDD